MLFRVCNACVIIVIMTLSYVASGVLTAGNTQPTAAPCRSSNDNCMWAHGPNSIALVMIVKDEAHVIERSLRLLLPHISAWTIVDTGSTDDTPAIIRRVMANMPGALHHREWRDFASNRNEALELARPLAPWLFMFDADDVLHSTGFVFDTKPCAAYSITLNRGGVLYQNTRLFNSSHPWAYRGVLHEYPFSADGADLPTLSQPAAAVWIDSRAEGGRSANTRDKYVNDALLLERELAKDTGDERDDLDVHRTTFYCANSWRDAGSPANASKWYLARATGGGWVEERYVSFLNLIRLEPDVQTQLRYAWAALELGTRRWEATHAALLGVRERGAWSQEAYWLGRASVDAGGVLAEWTLFGEATVYQYMFQDEFSIVAFWTNHFAESRDAASAALLAAPADQQARIRANIAHAVSRL